MFLRLLVVSVWFLSVSASAAQVLEDFLNDFKTLKAHFTQTLYDEKGAVLEVSSGKLYLQRPGRFHWSYEAPYEQLIIADGSSIWIYDQDLEQVTIKDFDVSTENTPALLLSSERPISDFFTVESLPDNASGEAQVKLLPKSPDAQFALMQLLFNGLTLSRLHVQDKLGQTSVIAFSAQQRNVPLPAHLFEFPPPAGIDLIDGRE